MDAFTTIAAAYGIAGVLIGALALATWLRARCVRTLLARADHDTSQ